MFNQWGGEIIEDNLRGILLTIVAMHAAALLNQMSKEV
jgi:hypothetical protein